MAEDPAERKRGRPPYVPTDRDRKTVEAMAACGIPHDDIGLVVGLAAKALRKHFRAELDLAMIQANAKVAATLFAAAVSGKDIAATIFWCKTRLKWQEISAHRMVDVEGKDRTMSLADMRAYMQSIPDA